MISRAHFFLLITSHTLRGSLGESDGCGTRITCAYLPVPCLSLSTGTNPNSGGRSDWSFINAAWEESKQLRFHTGFRHRGGANRCQAHAPHGCVAQECQNPLCQVVSALQDGKVGRMRRCPAQSEQVDNAADNLPSAR